jgi:multisubunit Na+/H+ antiporter MnhB subunit
MEMSFREKSAWISLVLILLVFGPYFWLVGQSFAGQTHVHGATQFALILLFVVLEIVVHIAVAIQSPRDAEAPIDEREDLIDLRATRMAFYVLFGGALMSIFTLHFPVNVWTLSQFVLFSIVIAELVKFASQIVFYRRGV